MVDYDDFAEVYEVTKVLEVVIQGDRSGAGEDTSTMRIEVRHALPAGDYSIGWSIRDHIEGMPSYPQGSSVTPRKPITVPVWVPIEMPWVSEKTEDAAVRRAIGWMKKRGM